ncbi:hypothetical protein HKD37_03G008462 [Glycine soja]
MAKVAKPSSVPSSSHQLGSGPLKTGSMARKKTPSELRGELLKRASVVDFTDESQPPLADPTKTTEVDNGFKKSKLWKPPRYTDTRVDEVFAAKKSRFKIASGKENAKENPSLGQTSNLKNLSVFSTFEAKGHQGNTCLENSVTSSEVSKASVLQSCQTFEKWSQGKFRSVAELSSAVDTSCGTATIDLGKALRGLAALEPSNPNDTAADLSEGQDLTAVKGNFLSEFHLPGKKVLLDLTLKTSMRIVSSSSVNCTAQFVVMFTGGDSSGKSKCSCHAYISQSTQGLRSLLREHDLCFSMPLCHSKVEQVSTEDLVELSEIEKQNLGQTRRLRSFSDVDNSPESLLAFSGNNNVHALYDFLLNYRFLLTSLSSVDVPVLCSPVPFQNSALSSPDIKCVETRRAEDIAASYNGSIWKDGESAQGSSDSLCTIEIKDALLPPWIICGICALMASEGRSFEASFVTEPSSIGLNVALKSTCEKPESKAAGSESLQDHGSTFGIPEAVVTSGLCSCSLKGVRYSDESYTASLSPV